MARRRLVIRAGTVRDVPTILALIRGLAEYERLAHQMAATAGRVRAHGFGPRRYFQTLICRRGGKPVGFALYTFNYSVWTAARGIFIEDIWVIPEERRGGVARALMVALALECAAKGYKRIDLNVLDWNPARGFYEKIGFRWIKNWLPYRLSGEALEKLAATP